MNKRDRSIRNYTGCMITTAQSIALRSPFIVLFLGVLIGVLLTSLTTIITQTSLNAECNLPSRDFSAHSLRKSFPIYDMNDGWKAIYVFVGAPADPSTQVAQMLEESKVNSPYYYKAQWFSQSRQDEVVFQMLRKKKNGFFLDLAGNDAIQISNSFALEHHHNWTGIVIEPNPMYWPAMAYRKCAVVAAVVGHETNQEMKFKFSNAAYGGLVGSTFDNKAESTESGEGKNRFTVSLIDIFAKFEVPKVIDYFSLDVEGAEGFIMEAFPFDLYRFNVLTIERPNKELCKLLEQNGYQLLKKLVYFGETLWIHSSLMEEKNKHLIDLTALDIDTENYTYKEQTQ